MNSSTLGSPTGSILARLNQNQAGFARSIARLSSGSLLTDPAGNTAGVTDAGKLAAQNQRVQAASANVQNAISYLQAGDGNLGTVGQMLSRMGELTTLAADPTKTTSDLAGYRQEFTSLQDQLRATIGGTTGEIGGTAGVTSPQGSFNGTALFGPTAGPTVAIGSAAGETLVIPATNLRTGPMLSLIAQDAAGNYTAKVTDDTALTAVSGATDQVGAARADLGGVSSRLQIAGATLQVQSQNLSAAVSDISDVDVARESTQLARFNVLQQAGTAMLAQANQSPQAVLKLLRQ